MFEIKVKGGRTMPTPEQHAVLSASSSARWLNCTASARLAEKCPRQDTQTRRLLKPRA